MWRSCIFPPQLTFEFNDVLCALSECSSQLLFADGHQILQICTVNRAAAFRSLLYGCGISVHMSGWIGIKIVF